MLRYAVFVALFLCLTASVSHADTAAELKALDASVHAAQKSDPIAVVNGVEIPRWMYDNALRDRLATLAKTKQQEPAAVAQAQQAILDNLIQVELFVQDAARHKVSASEGAGRLRLSIMERGYGGEAAFAETLAKHGMTRDQYVAIWQQQVSANRLVEEVLKPKVEVSEAAIVARYNQDAAQLRIPRRVNVQEVFAPILDNQSLEAMRGLMNTALPSLQNATDFLAAAKDAEPLKKLYNMKAKNRGWVLAEDNATLDAAGQAQWTENATVGPFASEAGMHLWRIRALQTPRMASLDDVRESLTAQMIEEATHAAVAEHFETLRRDADINILLEQ